MISAERKPWILIRLFLPGIFRRHSRRHLGSMDPIKSGVVRATLLTPTQLFRAFVTCCCTKTSLVELAILPSVRPTIWAA